MKITYSPKLVNAVFGRLGAIVMGTLGLGLMGFVALMVMNLREERSKALELLSERETAHLGMEKIQKILAIDPLDSALIQKLTEAILFDVQSSDRNLEERLLALHHFQLKFPNLRRLDQVNLELIREYMANSSAPSERLRDHMFLTLNRLSPQSNHQKDLVAFIRKNYRERNSK